MEHGMDCKEEKNQIKSLSLEKVLECYMESVLPYGLELWTIITQTEKFLEA